MKSNKELKDLAWKRLWSEHWLGRLFFGGALLGFCGYVIQIAITKATFNFGVLSWFDYFQAVGQNKIDVTTPIPKLTKLFVLQATSSTLLEVFFSLLMSGIVAYGCAVILKKCLVNEEKGWLKASFGGFKYPFGMVWLTLRTWLIWIGWALFLVILPPLGVFFLIVLFYRYRFIWLVKVEHPDWSAGACLKYCRELMKGHKRESFKLDCAYWLPITLMLLPPLAVLAIFCFCVIRGVDGEAFGAVIGVALLLGFLVDLPLMIIVPQYISVGQGLLYEELKGRMPDDSRQ